MSFREACPYGVRCLDCCCGGWRPGSGLKVNQADNYCTRYTTVLYRYIWESFADPAWHGLDRAARAKCPPTPVLSLQATAYTLCPNASTPPLQTTPLSPPYAYAPTPLPSAQAHSANQCLSSTPIHSGGCATNPILSISTPLNLSGTCSPDLSILPVKPLVTSFR